MFRSKGRTHDVQGSRRERGIFTLPAGPRWQRDARLPGIFPPSTASYPPGTKTNVMTFKGNETTSESQHAAGPTGQPGQEPPATDERFWVRCLRMVFVTFIYKPIKSLLWIMKPLVVYVLELLESFSSVAAAPLAIFMMAWVFIGLPWLISTGVL
ncbi:hypothetical protein CCHR01_05752 [Colletotrichum chrysophilum]|uniref:Uncharacterized protein n=1 Tax=Colletotrichum chrysophilum TaxID=1836956 RepID=A0AAD9ARZ9_9PEZI|nr:hypothetical protein K456DRAFT_43279 [Colletotrichum gloeosporioides 23]KAK1851650.1 hypothetical protein CCHR01_05752 [Colletotrichum chrysophilum]